MNVLFWGNFYSIATLETYTHSYSGLKWVYFEESKKKCYARSSLVVLLDRQIERASKKVAEVWFVLLILNVLKIQYQHWPLTKNEDSPNEEEVEECKNARRDLNVKARLVEKNNASYVQSSSENVEMPEVNNERFEYPERTTWTVEIQQKGLLQGKQGRAVTPRKLMILWDRPYVRILVLDGMTEQKSSSKYAVVSNGKK